MIVDFYSSLDQRGRVLLTDLKIHEHYLNLMMLILKGALISCKNQRTIERETFSSTRSSIQSTKENLHRNKIFLASTTSNKIFFAMHKGEKVSLILKNLKNSLESRHFYLFQEQDLHINKIIVSSSSTSLLYTNDERAFLSSSQERTFTCSSRVLYDVGLVNLNILSLDDSLGLMQQINPFEPLELLEPL